MRAVLKTLHDQVSRLLNQIHDKRIHKLYAPIADTMYLIEHTLPRARAAMACDMKTTPTDTQVIDYARLSSQKIALCDELNRLKNQAGEIMTGLKVASDILFRLEDELPSADPSPWDRESQAVARSVLGRMVERWGYGFNIPAILPAGAGMDLMTMSEVVRKLCADYDRAAMPKGAKRGG